MSVEPREPRLLKRPLIAGGIVLTLFEAGHHLLPKSWVSGHPSVQIVLAVTGVVVLGFAIVGWLRSRRETREARGIGRWPMGRVYNVSIDLGLDGKPKPGMLVFDAEREAIEWRSGGSASVIGFDEVRAVRVRLFIEIDSVVCTLRVNPSSYEDRQRLLWELALRCNAAVERGLDETAAPRPSEPPPAAPIDAAPPIRVAPASDAERTSLDRGMTGLASALAPTANPTPAPPRKSGLGVGLFVPPPGVPRDDDA